MQMTDRDVSQPNWARKATKQIAMDMKQTVYASGTFSLWSLKQFELKWNEGAIGLAPLKWIFKVDRKVIDAYIGVEEKMNPPTRGADVVLT